MVGSEQSGRGVRRRVNSALGRGRLGHVACGLLIAVTADMAQATGFDSRSVSPEFPPATTYGSTMFREDDPRSHYEPYHAMPLDASAPIDILLQKLWMTENEAGAYSPSLVPDLQELAAAYFADGQYPDAIEKYRRAIHLMRVNEGLNTFSQTGMVEQLIEAYYQLGDYIAADDQQQYLFRVRKENLSPSDPQMMEYVEQLADWHRAAYLGQLDRYRYPRIVKLLDLYAGMADDVEEQEGDLSRNRLPYLQGRLRTHYMLSVYPGESEETLQVEAGQRDDIELPDLTRLRFSAFLKDNFRQGLATIRDMRRVLENDPDTEAAELADVMVMKADWYQWYRRYAQAINAYQEAWEHVEGKPNADNWRRATFGNPLELPSQVVFQPGIMPIRLYNVAEVHVKFMVSRHGEAEDIEIIAPDREDNQPAVTRGYNYLRDLRFRPRVEDGLVVAADSVERIYSIRY